MPDLVEITPEAKQEIDKLISGDDKNRRHVRIFIQGWG